MKKIFAILALIPFFALADLTVEHLSPNVVVVSGTGNGEYPGVVITNVIGYCTNCVAATPQQMRQIKDELAEFTSAIADFSQSIFQNSSKIQLQINARNEDVSNFYHVNNEIGAVVVNGSFTVISNLVYNNPIQSTQKSLTKNLIENYSGSGAWNSNKSRMVVGYFDGIYDYAHSQDSEYTRMSDRLSDLQLDAEYADMYAQSIYQKVCDIPEEACTEITYLPGYAPGEGGSSTTNVPGIGIEQLDTILEYLRHIDEDQHTRSNQLSYISTNIVILKERTDATYELLRMSLMNDATIITDDGVNSWSNVYNNGSSQLYDYNRSNILQRIELLLYGVSGINSDIETDTASYEQSMETIETSLHQSQENLTASLQGHSQKLSTIGDSLKGFFQSASFLGQGSIAYTIFPSVSITIGQDNFDVHSLAMDEAQHSIVESFCGFVRIAFQVVFHVTGIILIFFYYKWFISACNKLFRWLWDLINGMLGDS